MPPPARPGTFDVLAERVLQAVEQLPRGSVVSYGDLAELVGTTPRMVGAVMSQFGSEVAWWRVVGHDGRLPAHLLDRARRHWPDESIASTEKGCRIERHRADLDELAERYAEAVDQLDRDR